MALLEVEGLSVSFDTPDGVVQAATDVAFTLDSGEALAIVGESGSGKTQTALAIMGLLAANGHCTGSARLQGRELVGMPPDSLNAVRGDRIAMIFQDPMTSLNPYLTVASQMIEVLVLHKGMEVSTARSEALRMLDAVHIPDAAARIDRYPHEFSGGMRQRVMIATALLCRPDLLMADEPTTALDVTVQAQILALLAEVREEFGSAVLLITHDLGIVAGNCDRLLVMYAGRVMEAGSPQSLFTASSHPYTRALLRSVPRLDRPRTAQLEAIAGNPPSLLATPTGCPFEPRCEYRLARCRDTMPDLEIVGDGHIKACHRESMN